MARLGFIAHRVLAAGEAGTVFATFDRSAYLDVGGHLVCLSTPAIDDGPLTVPCPDLRVLGPGEPYAPAIAPGPVWRPSVPAGWCAEDLKRGLQYLDALTQEMRFVEGLGGFVCVAGLLSPANRVAEAARAPVQRLAEWLQAAFAGNGGAAPELLCLLVGAGPGLTPSGDDFLGGAMIAAHAVQRPDVAERIHAVVRTGDTARISRAHLDAAREGAAGAPLHALLNDVICGRAAALPARFAALGRMGHCSGWDAFAGCVVALRAWCGSPYSS